MTERYLESRSALVTGGATGQGRAIAGVFTHLPSRKDTDTVCEEIEAHGVRAMGADYDLRSSDSCEALYQAAVGTFGGET